jgi:hypothetical protein
MAWTWSDNEPDDGPDERELRRPGSDAGRSGDDRYRDDQAPTGRPHEGVTGGDRLPGDRARADPHERAREGLEHLQAAARELIQAARAVLDVAEALVDDPDAVASLAGVVGNLANLGSLVRHRGGSARHRADGDDDARADPDATVERISVV